MAVEVVDSACVAGAASFYTGQVGAAVEGDYIMHIASISIQTVATPTGWTAHHAEPVAGGTRRVYIFGKVCASGEAPTTFNFSGSANANIARVTVRGQDPTTPIDVAPASSSSSSNGSTLTAPSAEVVTPGALLLAHFVSISVSTSATFSTPSGMTLTTASTGTGSNGLSAMVSRETRVAAGATGTRVSTCGVSAPWAATTFAIRPAAAPPAGDPSQFLPFFG